MVLVSQVNAQVRETIREGRREAGRIQYVCDVEFLHLFQVERRVNRTNVELYKKEEKNEVDNRLKKEKWATR